MFDSSNVDQFDFSRARTARPAQTLQALCTNRRQIPVCGWAFSGSGWTPTGLNFPAESEAGKLSVQSASKLERPGVEIVNLGLVDSARKSALKRDTCFRREDVDLIFLHVTTYALSSTVLPVVQWAKVPVIVLNFNLPRRWIMRASIRWAIGRP